MTKENLFYSDILILSLRRIRDLIFFHTIFTTFYDEKIDYMLRWKNECAFIVLDPYIIGKKRILRFDIC